MGSMAALRSALHFRYSIVIPASFPALIRLNPNNHYNHGFNIAHNQPQQQFIHIVKHNMVAQYSDTCVIPNCYICTRLKLKFI